MTAFEQRSRRRWSSAGLALVGAAVLGTVGLGAAHGQTCSPQELANQVGRAELAFVGAAVDSKSQPGADGSSEHFHLFEVERYIVGDGDGLEVVASRSGGDTEIEDSFPLGERVAVVAERGRQSLTAIFVDCAPQLSAEQLSAVTVEAPEVASGVLAVIAPARLGSAEVVGLDPTGGIVAAGEGTGVSEAALCPGGEFFATIGSGRVGVRSTADFGPRWFVAVNGELGEEAYCADESGETVLVVDIGFPDRESAVLAFDARGVTVRVFGNARWIDPVNDLAIGGPDGNEVVDELGNPVAMLPEGMQAWAGALARDGATLALVGGPVEGDRVTEVLFVDLESGAVSRSAALPEGIAPPTELAWSDSQTVFFESEQGLVTASVDGSASVTPLTGGFGVAIAGSRTLWSGSDRLLLRSASDPAVEVFAAPQGAEQFEAPLILPAPMTVEGQVGARSAVDRAVTLSSRRTDLARAIDDEIPDEVRSESQVSLVTRTPAVPIANPGPNDDDVLAQYIRLEPESRRGPLLVGIALLAMSGLVYLLRRLRTTSQPD